MRHAFVIPLIGGQVIAQAAVLGIEPEFMQSFLQFSANDAHIRRWWPEVPFDVLNAGPVERRPNVQIVGSTCPCAGLSALSRVSHASNPANDWLYTTAEYVLGILKPDLYWGENAPALSSQKGWFVANKLYAIGKKYGYSFSMYRTASKLHGLPQFRRRTYYFFWHCNKVPVFPWHREPEVTIEDWFETSRPRDANSDIFVKSSKPSDLPMYQFLLKRTGMDHAGFVASLKHTTSVITYLYKNELFKECIEWLYAHDLQHDAQRVTYWKQKYDAGSGMTDRYLILPKVSISAFVSPLPWDLAHPTQDRFLNLREMMDLMGMPLDFKLASSIKNGAHHLTQNTPVKTSSDVMRMARAALNDEYEWTTRDDGSWLVFNNCTQEVYSWQSA